MISYYKYYLEMKNRVFLLITCWGVVSVTCYIYKEPILFLLIKPSNYSQMAENKAYFIFTDVSEIFYVYLQITFFVSNQIATVMVLYHVLLFLSSGLYKLEYKKLQFAFKFFILSWLGSIVLLNKFIVPLSWSFFLSFQQTDNISFFFEARIVEYFNYFTNLYYVCFINCQILTIVALTLNNYNDNIRKIRKLFYLIFVIFSTLTTPPDIISQILVSISLILFYELLLFSNILKLIR